MYLYLWHISALVSVEFEDIHTTLTKHKQGRVIISLIIGPLTLSCSVWVDLLFAFLSSLTLSS